MGKNWQTVKSQRTVYFLNELHKKKGVLPKRVEKMAISTKKGRELFVRISFRPFLPYHFFEANPPPPHSQPKPNATTATPQAAAVVGVLHLGARRADGTHVGEVLAVGGGGIPGTPP